MRLNTESKLPRLLASALKVSVGGWAGILPIIKSLPNEAWAVTMSFGTNVN